MMMSDSQRMMVRTHGTMVGRMLLGLLFVVSGWRMLSDVGLSGVTNMLDSMGVPLAALAAIVMLVIKIGGGLALMLGYRTGCAAGALILFVLGATWFGHVNVEPFDLIGTLKNLAIVGGLLYALAYGAGEGWKLGK